MLRLLCFFLLTAFASAQETMFRQTYDTETDTNVEVLALFSKPSAVGYFPVRVKLANNLKTEQMIRIAFDATGQYGDTLRAHSSFTFSAAPGKTITRDIMVPLSPTSGSSSYVNVVASLSGSLGMASGSANLYLNDNQPSVLLSESLYTKNASLLDAEATTKLGGSASRVEFAAKFDPKQLPDDWLAYSGYDSVVMTENDWSDIPPGGKNAILSWLRIGGHLVIFNSSRATLSTLNIPSDQSFGSVSLRAIGSDLAMNEKSFVAEIYGMPDTKSTIGKDFNGGWQLQTLFGEKAFRYVIFIIVLIIFGILVGPVNLFVFAKSGKRHRLFITTPIISLGASIILIAMIIFQDGFGGSGERLVLMDVRPDGDQNAAFVLQEQIARTGVLTKSTFSLDTPALFLPVPIAQTRWARFTNDSGEAKGTFNLQPNGARTEASGDWFQSRSEHGHELRAVIPTRGRIEFAGGTERVVSSFDYPIQTLFYFDKEGKWHRANGLETGKPAALLPVDASMIDPELTKIHESFTEDIARRFLKVSHRPGCFIAITEKAPGIATHPGVQWKKTRTILTGPVVTP